jgi:sigma-E factor negative regulatory protein RseB
MILTAVVLRGMVASIVALGLTGSSALVGKVGGAATAAHRADSGRLRLESAVSTDPKALELLAKAAAAAQLTLYSGVQFVSSWGQTSTSSYMVKIRNIPGTGAEVLVTEGRGGSVSGFVPSGKIGTGKQATATTQSQGNRQLAVLARNYRVVVTGEETVAGRPATVIEAYRNSEQLAARLWLDRQTSLLLRREVYTDGSLTQASAFISVAIGQPVFARHLSPIFARPRTEQIPEAGLASLRSAGWRCPTFTSAGFFLMDARREDSGRGPVVHLSYSDGLSNVSIVERRGRWDPSSMTGYQAREVPGGVVYVREETTVVVAWSADGSAYVALGDTPMVTMMELTSSLRRNSESSDDSLHRLRRGLSRVGSWFDPWE